MTASARPAPSPIVQPEQPAVLIVEDETIVALDLRGRVEGLGYRVVGGEVTGAAALSSAAALRPDIVLMDIRLRGDLDGISAADELRRTSDCAVIFITAYADEATLARASAVVPYGYLLKPFDDRALSVIMRATLQRRELIRKLRESEAWIATTLRCAGDAVLGVIATDPNGVVRAINAEAERLTGATQTAIGRPLSEILTAVPCATHEFRRPYADHELLTTAAGAAFPIESVRSPILDEASHLWHCLGLPGHLGASAA